MMEFLAANFNLPTIIVSIIVFRRYGLAHCITSTRPAALAAATAPAGAAAAAADAIAAVAVATAVTAAAATKNKIPKSPDGGAGGCPHPFCCKRRESP